MFYDCTLALKANILIVMANAAGYSSVIREILHAPTDATSFYHLQFSFNSEEEHYCGICP
jgi:hypothetical protein